MGEEWAQIGPIATRGGCCGLQPSVNVFSVQDPWGTKQTEKSFTPATATRSQPGGRTYTSAKCLTCTAVLAVRSHCYWAHPYTDPESDLADWGENSRAHSQGSLSEGNRHIWETNHRCVLLLQISSITSLQSIHCLQWGYIWLQSTTAIWPNTRVHMENLPHISTGLCYGAIIDNRQQSKSNTHTHTRRPSFLSLSRLFYRLLSCYNN